MNMTTFLNRPDTDDTLQNIRKEYLNTKRNLQDLLTSSPTRIAQGTRMGGDSGGKPMGMHMGGRQQSPVPQVQLHQSQKQAPMHQMQQQARSLGPEQDNRLRQQLRDYMATKDRENIGIPSKPVAGAIQSDNGGMQWQLENQKILINSLKRELETQRTINSLIFERLERLEDELRYVRHSNNKQQSTVGASYRPVNSAPSSSHTNGNAGSYMSGDDTKVLLGWEQPQQMAQQMPPPQAPTTKPPQHGRTLSNFDDNTTRLIQMSGYGKPRW